MTHYQAKSSFHTLFFQGVICNKYQLTKYNGGKAITSKCGKKIYCEGKNSLKPINVLVHPFIGKEIKDVISHPFKHLSSYLNPFTVVTALGSRFVSWYQGIKEYDGTSDSSVYKNYALNIGEMNLGQEVDIASHYQNYLLWKKRHPNDKLVLWGVSRGGAVTFNAYAKYHYPEVKLVVLEACFDTLQGTLDEGCFSKVSNLISSGLSLFTKYKPTGPSPAESIEQFPDNVPVVFISSKKDAIVPYSNTLKLAQKLADRGTNEVYLLVLENSSHPNYMFDDSEDRKKYETFIHAIYEKYHIPHRNRLAKQGRELLSSCLLKPSNQEDCNLQLRS